MQLKNLGWLVVIAVAIIAGVFLAEFRQVSIFDAEVMSSKGTVNYNGNDFEVFYGERIFNNPCPGANSHSVSSFLELKNSVGACRGGANGNQGRQNTVLLKKGMQDFDKIEFDYGISSSLSRDSRNNQPKFLLAVEINNEVARISEANAEFESKQFSEEGKIIIEKQGNEFVIFKKKGILQELGRVAAQETNTLIIGIQTSAFGDGTNQGSASTTLQISNLVVSGGQLNLLPAYNPPALPLAQSIIQSIIDFLRRLFSGDIPFFSIAGPELVLPNTQATYGIDIALPAFDADSSDGKVDSRFATWALVDKNFNIVQQRGAWVGVTDRYKEQLNILTPNTLNDYVLTGMVIESKGTYDLSAGVWRKTEWQVIASEGINLKTKAPTPMIQPPPEGVSFLQGLIGKIWTWLLGLFG